MVKTKSGLGTLYIVAVPIGNPEDWTYRAQSVLKEADVVAAEDTRVLKRELAKVKIKPKKVVSHHDHNESTSTKGLIDLLLAGKSVALASDAGTPLISDPGYRLVREVLGKGIKIVPVPGPSSLTSALCVSAIGTANFFFGGFLPVQNEARKKYLYRHKRSADALVFFEAPHRLREMLVDAEEVLGPETETMICRELTKPYEDIRWASLKDIRRHFQVNEPRGEFVVVFKGASENLLSEEETENEVRRLLGFGRSASDILEELQPLTAMTRKQLYNLIIRTKAPPI